MMLFNSWCRSGLIAAAGVFSLAGTSEAATVNATSANIYAVWLAAKPGDTIHLSGAFTGAALQNKISKPPITIDATRATFTDTLKFQNVDGVKVVGGTFDSRGGPTHYGRAIVVYTSSNISFDRTTIIGPGAGAGAGQGISLVNVNNAKVTNGSFTGLSLGVGVSGSTKITLSTNKVVNAAVDGFDITDSHTVLVANNSCSGGSPNSGAHPDCVQLWSATGHAVQSDVTVRDNIATGNTQGFTSFDPQKGGGLRFIFTGNIVNTMQPQGIACYACVDSSFTGNFLSALPDAAHLTNLNIIGGSNNAIYGNTLRALSDKIVLPTSYADAYFALTGRAYMPSFAGLDEGDLAEGTGAVPEPGVWLMLVIGFGVVGRSMRRRPVAAAA